MTTKTRSLLMVGFGVLVGSLTTAWVSQGLPAATATVPHVAVAETKLDETSLKKLRELATEELSLNNNLIKTGPWNINNLPRVIDVSQRLLKVELKLAKKAEDRTAAHKAYVTEMKNLHDILKGRLENGLVTKSDMLYVTYMLTEAEAEAAAAK
ncbi:MAG: hypothetical protein ACRCZF_16895 [Gemmataceae bacterium]